MLGRLPTVARQFLITAARAGVAAGAPGMATHVLVRTLASAPTPQQNADNAPRQSFSDYLNSEQAKRLTEALSKKHATREQPEEEAKTEWPGVTSPFDHKGDSVDPNNPLPLIPGASPEAEKNAELSALRASIQRESDPYLQAQCVAIRTGLPVETVLEQARDLAQEGYKSLRVNGGESFDARKSFTDALLEVLENALQAQQQPAETAAKPSTQRSSVKPGAPDPRSRRGFSTTSGTPAPEDSLQADEEAAFSTYLGSPKADEASKRLATRHAIRDAAKEAAEGPNTVLDGTRVDYTNHPDYNKGTPEQFFGS